MVDRVLSDRQINEFAERGYIVVPQVVPGNILAKAAQRIDKVAAADPPARTNAGPISTSSKPRTSRI